MSALGAIVDRTPVNTIQDVLARMREIDAALAPSDGISCFNKLYMTVTEKVIEAEGAGAFASNGFLTALDVAFGNLYFAALRALEAGAAVPRAWAPLFAARASQGIAPLQFALAGMNAHINRDLPVGLVQTFAQLGIDMQRPSPQADDFDRVNGVLASSETEVRDRYFTPLMAALHQDGDGLDDVAANWSVKEARAAAWTNGAALWQLRAFGTLSAAYLDALDGMVGFAGRGLLVALG